MSSIPTRNYWWFLLLIPRKNFKCTCGMVKCRAI